jgi:hypothetical protein
MRILFLALALVATAASAQTKPVTLGSPATSQTPKKIELIKEDPPQAIDSAHQATPEQIREYFALVHLGDNMKTLMSQMISGMKATSAPYIPDDVWQDMDKSMSSFDFLSELIPIYQKHLSRDDMEGVLTFYRTDAGKHLLANQTTMSSEAQAAFRTIGERLGEQVGERHADEIAAAKKKYEDGIAAKQSINMNPDPK